MTLQLFWIITIICINLLSGLANSFKKVSIDYKIKVKQFSYSFNSDDFWSVILILTMYFIAIKTVNLPDIKNYNYLYLGDLSKSEIGFKFFISLSHLLNLSFFQFRAVIIAISYIFIWMSLQKMELNKSLVLAMYSLFCYNLDVIQIRNLLALSIILYSITFIVLPTKNSILKYIIGISLASLFHVVSILYFLLLLTHSNFIKRKFFKQFILLFFVVSILISLFLKIFSSSDMILINLFRMVDIEKADFYLSEEINNGFLVYWFMHIFFLISSLYIRKSYYYLKEKNHVSILLDKIFWINMVISVFLPLCILNLNFYRIFRNLLLLNYGLLGVILKSPNNYYRFVSFLFGLVGYLYILLYNLPIQPENLIMPFLSSN